RSSSIVAQAELIPHLACLPMAGRTPFQRESETYLDSVDVTTIFQRFCEKNKWKRPILVSYQPHLWRGVMVARKLGMDVLIAEVPAAIYESDSSQFWMRSPWLNYPR